MEQDRDVEKYTEPRGKHGVVPPHASSRISHPLWCFSPQPSLPDSATASPTQSVSAKTWLTITLPMPASSLAFSASRSLHSETPNVPS